ncbi:hypothetical protein DNTS_022815, partial [Danionella cerebrum]
PPVELHFSHWMLTLCPPMAGVSVVATASLPPCPVELSKCFQNDSSPFTCSTQTPSVNPPPPPPPPPPLPLPPPPPPPPSFGDPFAQTVQRRSRMRNFNWDAIPRHSVLGKRNVWTAHRNLENFKLDTKRMEELFSHDEHQCVLRKGGTVRKSVWGLTQVTAETASVSILNSKKSMNIGILLKQFKRTPKDIVEAVRHGNLCFALGKLRELSKLLPDDNETKKLLSFSGDLTLLNEADRFMVMLLQVPGYKLRIKSLLLREEFFPFIEEIKHSIAVLITAANELLACDDLHSIIRLVLKAGNYMNAGGYAGSAIGFRMASLLKLVDTKANKPGMNLMHYVSMVQAQQIDESLLRFTVQLQHIGIAARIQKQEVEIDFQREFAKIGEAKVDVSKQPDLHHQMEAFLRMADVRLTDVEISLQELNSISTSVAEYFCEDPATFRLEECCSIFHSFCERFERATRENHEREVAETRKTQQREREKLTRRAKRRSIGSCSDKDVKTDASSLESVLTSFLNQRPTRRRPGVLTKSAMCSMRNILPQVEKQEVNKDLDSPVESKEENPEFSRVHETEGILKDVPPCEVSEVQRARAASKRGQCIDDEPVPEGDVGSSSTSVKDGFALGGVVDNGAETKVMEKVGKQSKEADEKVEEADNITELSGKTLRFQESSLNGTTTPDRFRGHGVSTSTPRQKDVKEVDLALQNGLGGLGSPWTILSPRLSPHNTSQRRHSFSISRIDILDDGVWALPDTPVKQPLPNKSHVVSLSDCTTKPNHAHGRSASLPDEKEMAPNFRLGQMFQRCIGQELPPDKRPEGSGLVSFFRRFGERTRAGTVG